MRSAFLIDLLTPSKVFSLLTQKPNSRIIETVGGAEKTKRNYKRLLKKVQGDSNKVFELPTLKSGRKSKGKVTRTIKWMIWYTKGNV